MFQNLPLFPQAASSLAGRVDALFFAALAMTIFFTLLIAALIVFFMLRYKRRHSEQVGQPEHGSNRLEIAWSVIPLGITLVFFGWGLQVFLHQFRAPGNATEYYCVGKQWMWKFQHPEGNREIDELHVPVGQPVKIIMTSEDVIHSLYIPAFRIKADVLPGRYTTLWFQPTRTGTYHLFCAEYCGSLHSRMIGRVVVMEPADYEAWLAGGTRTASVVARGEELFGMYACSNCHQSGDLGRGPALAGLFGRPVQLQGGGRVIAHEAYLRESILDPQAKLVAGYGPIMPTFQGQISEEELLQIIAYIKSLAGAAPPHRGGLPPKQASFSEGQVP